MSQFGLSVNLRENHTLSSDCQATIELNLLPGTGTHPCLFPSWCIVAGLAHSLQEFWNFSNGCKGWPPGSYN